MLPFRSWLVIASSDERDRDRQHADNQRRRRNADAMHGFGERSRKIRKEYSEKKPDVEFDKVANWYLTDRSTDCGLDYK